MKSWRCTTSKLLRSLPLWAAALWWGSLTTVGFFVVPMLFANLPTPAMAGTMAGKLFSAQTAISVACGLFLLLCFRANQLPALADTAQRASVFVVGGMLLALLSEFGVAPHIIARTNLALWHTTGTVMFAVQWVCAAVVFAKAARPAH